MKAEHSYWHSRAQHHTHVAVVRYFQDGSKPANVRSIEHRCGVVNCQAEPCNRTATFQDTEEIRCCLQSLQCRCQNKRGGFEHIRLRIQVVVVIAKFSRLSQVDEL